MIHLYIGVITEYRSTFQMQKTNTTSGMIKRVINEIIKKPDKVQYFSLPDGMKQSNKPQSIQTSNNATSKDSSLFQDQTNGDSPRISTNTNPHYQKKINSENLKHDQLKSGGNSLLENVKTAAREFSSVGGKICFKIKIFLKALFKRGVNSKTYYDERMEDKDIGAQEIFKDIANNMKRPEVVKLTKRDLRYMDNDKRYWQPDDNHILGKIKLESRAIIKVQDEDGKVIYLQKINPLSDNQFARVDVKKGKGENGEMCYGIKP